MADSIIRDPNNGQGAEVDSNSHLHVQSVQMSIQEFLVTKGDTYNVNSANPSDGSDFTLTGTTETAVLYFQNGEPEDALINLLVYMSGTSTGGNDVVWRAYKKSSAMTGDIVTGANNSIFENKNIGSSKTMADSLAYRGDASDTTLDSNATLFVQTIATDASRAALNLGGILLGKGNSVIITCEPLTGNTSLRVNAAMSVAHLKAITI